MDRETVAVLSYRAIHVVFVVGVLTSMTLQTPAFMGPVFVASGLQQIYFRKELATYYAKVPAVWLGHRGSLRQARFHLVVGLCWLMLGLFISGAWILQVVGLIM